jgi:pimeloyl-ACP methyl ester carboxylesterase
VVVTSLPGYGFSDPPAGPMLEAATADRWCRLLRDGLGYERFGAHGSDVGAGVTIQLGRRHPGQLVGIHLSAFYLEPPPRPWPPVEVHPRPAPHQPDHLVGDRHHRLGDARLLRLRALRAPAAARLAGPGAVGVRRVRRQLPSRQRPPTPRAPLRPRARLERS